jgi:BirA family biotin operon repressor/biotin-[acetyl-CoA-carboxylase] ligase
MSVGSTMDEAFRLGLDGAPEGALVVAEAQTRGRGRLGRNWSSPKSKGIYFSLILRPKIPPAQAPMLTLAAAVAVTRAVTAAASGLTPRIKWPNDILLGARKVCGILTELRAETDRVQFVVVGVGLNVNTTPTQLLPEATSLRIETGAGLSRLALLQDILRHYETVYLSFLKNGPAGILAEWRARCGTLGCQVRFSERGEPFVGIAEDLADDGSLLVRLPGGKVVRRMAGDILL